MVNPNYSYSDWNNKLLNTLNNINIHNLLNLCIVGSYLNTKNLYSLNDIDIVCIFSDYNAQEYISLYSQMTNLAESLSIMNIIVSVEMRLGPLKPDIPPKNFHHIQLHINSYDLNNWSKVVKYPGCFEWVNYNYHLKGKHLSKLVFIAPITIDEIIRDITVLMKNIYTHTAYSRVYSLMGNKLVSNMENVLLTTDQYAQLLISSFLFIIRNAQKAWQINQKDEIHIVWPKNYIELKNNVNRIKFQLKSGDKRAVKEALNIQNDIINFLLWINNEVLALKK